ncbi:MAG: hypothetical protein ACP5NW_01475 [Candidatus Woesearchaeota archaeon]
MRKIVFAVLGILLVVGAFLVFGKSAPQTTVSDVTPVINSDVAEANFAAIDDTGLGETSEGSEIVEPEVIVEDKNTLSYKYVLYEAFTGGYALRGQVFATPEDSVEGLTAKLYCNNVYVSESTTDSIGFFRVEGACKTGDVAYVQIGYDDESYNSRYLLLTKGVRGGQTPSVASVATSNSVPEFSTMTLGVAIILTTIGLVYLRKNE